MFVWEVVFVTLFALVNVCAVLFALYIYLFGLPEKHGEGPRRQVRR